MHKKTMIIGVIVVSTILICSACSTKMETRHRERLFHATNAIIVDHTCVDISRIPRQWIEKAKKLTIYYARTSDLRLGHVYEIVDIFPVIKSSVKFFS